MKNLLGKLCHFAAKLAGRHSAAFRFFSISSLFSNLKFHNSRWKPVLTKISNFEDGATLRSLTVPIVYGLVILQARLAACR